MERSALNVEHGTEQLLHARDYQVCVYSCVGLSIDFDVPTHLQHSVFKKNILVDILVNFLLNF